MNSNQRWCYKGHLHSVTLLFPIRRSAELMIRCIEECIRWKISTACTGALKSDVNMYLLCKNSSTRGSHSRSHRGSVYDRDQNS